MCFGVLMIGVWFFFFFLVLISRVCFWAYINGVSFGIFLIGVCFGGIDKWGVFWGY